MMKLYHLMASFAVLSLHMAPGHGRSPGSTSIRHYASQGTWSDITLKDRRCHPFIKKETERRHPVNNQGFAVEGGAFAHGAEHLRLALMVFFRTCSLNFKRYTINFAQSFL